MAPRPKASQHNSEVKDNEEAYRLKRDRNNVAVKKSREKSRQKAQETSERIAQLRQENVELEEQVLNLTNDLAILKNTLLKQVGGGIRKNSQKLCVTSSGVGLNSGSESKLVLADPKTVSQDHEYTGQKTEWNLPNIVNAGPSKQF